MPKAKPQPQPHKRTDPAKLAKEQAKIQKDMARRETPRGPLPNPGAVVKQVVDRVKARRKADRDRRAGFGPPPRTEGALVTGFKKPRADA